MLAAVARHTCDLVLIVVVGGLLGATLVRLAPGFDVDERQLDARLSEETLQLLRAERAGSANDTPRSSRRLAHCCWKSRSSCASCARLFTP